MALENAEVLSELKERYTTIVEQLNELSNTRVKIQGAIDVLQQIEESNNPSPEGGEVAPTEVVAEEAPAEEASE